MKLHKRCHAKHFSHAAPSWILWPTKLRLDGHKLHRCITLQCFEWRLQASMAHDHCCINLCSYDKQNDSGENLSFFNFPSNDFIEIKMNCRHITTSSPCQSVSTFILIKIKNKYWRNIGVWYTISPCWKQFFYNNLQSSLTKKEHPLKTCLWEQKNE